MLTPAEGLHKFPFLRRPPTDFTETEVGSGECVFYPRALSHVFSPVAVLQHCSCDPAVLPTGAPVAKPT